ncbi:MAG: methyltransferase, partial [Clostridia bacterium]|nr:methyltransferase [Clostridia bacterium]
MNKSNIMDAKAFLKDGERLDDLQLDGAFIISHKDKYCFTSDSVMLANMVSTNSKSKIVDLCSGGGIISILIALKKSFSEIIGVELQSDMADMATRSVKMNGLDSKVKIINHDVKNISDIIPNGYADIAVCNPPYYKINSGEIRENQNIAISRHEIALTLDELIKNTSKILKFGGTFYMVHKAERMAEVIYTLIKYNLIPKQIFTITTNDSDFADTFIVISKLGAKHGLIVK